MLLEKLYQTLRQRKRPEDVAELVEQLLQPTLSRAEAVVLAKATAHSLRRSAWQYTAMLEVFAATVGAARQVRKAAELFGFPVPPEASFDDPAVVDEFIAQLSPRLHKARGADNFLTDRLNRTGRRQASLELSRRQYNKLFRCLTRMEDKLRRIVAEAQKAEFQQIAKHGFAHHIAYTDFIRNVNAAAFVAYYTARCNVRSEFTIGGQQRPYDEIAQMLLRRCGGEALPAPSSAPTRGWQGLFGKRPVPAPAGGASPTADVSWWVIAQVYPDPDVLVRLDNKQKGKLLGRWTAVLQELADHLRAIWDANTFRKSSMVVKRGDDSSTWNAAAGAWNKARDSWINLIYGLGMDFVLDELCFGKVMRLMAADVVAWHQSAGNALDPNTQIWAELPLPWEVFAGAAPCGRPQVEAACARAKLDPAKSGWLAPRPHGVVAFVPTPELVHGVSVSNPYLAAVLKRHRYFSGKQPRLIYPEDN